MSAVIRHIHYNTASQTLSIWFGPEDRRYRYFNVPEALYEGFRSAESRGRFFNQSIRGRFDCQLAGPSEQANQRWQALRSAS